MIYLGLILGLFTTLIDFKFMRIIIVIIIFQSIICISLFGQSMNDRYFAVDFNNGVSLANNINYDGNDSNILYSYYDEIGLNYGFSNKSGLGFETGIKYFNTKIRFNLPDVYYNNPESKQSIHLSFIKIPLLFSYSFNNSEKKQLKTFVGLDFYRHISPFEKTRIIYSDIENVNYTFHSIINRLDLLNISLSFNCGLQYEYKLTKRINLFSKANISLGLTKVFYYNYIYSFEDKKFPNEKKEIIGVSNYKNDIIGLSLGIKYSILPIEKNKEKRNNKSKRNFN